MTNIWYTNADTLTRDKIEELKEEIKSSTPPDIIAITELKPKNYSRELIKNEYILDGYRFEEANLQDKGSTRGVAIYIRNSLNCSKIKSQKITFEEETPTDVISVELKLKKE